MDLKDFLQKRYETKHFLQFISERFYGFEESLSEHADEELNESEKQHIQSYRYLGSVGLDDGEELGFFEFLSKTPHIENKRVGYNAVLKKLADEYGLDGAIASFYHPDSNAWRLSFVGFEYDEGKAKVTNLKRYTYVLGEGIPIKTAYQQLKQLQYPKFEEIEEAFSVEAITDEFYKSYKLLFERIIEELHPQEASFAMLTKEKPEVAIRTFARRLLGRITFLYFLQKKGWLGVKKSWGDGDRNFLTKVYKDFIESRRKSSFFDEVMIPLFFTALNTPRENDYFEPLQCKIPFLNGGLFTKESYDLDDIFLSDELFGKIFETFDQYNFTIIEDLPHDSEVAIDPEMLGRVFENLIEENYRKGKGAFYTPREIVHYMCKQSIAMYLANFFEQEKIEELVNREITDDPYIKKHAVAIKEKLLQMRVLDPAIGSGAFPMGILQEVVQIIGNLNKAENPSKEKKQIIENSIYGVDIDGSAVDIAKLRFWLSIIVDEDEPFPLPNLAFKIMQGNSLIETIDGFSPVPEDLYTQKEPTKTSLFDEEHTLFDPNKFEKLRQNIHDFYNASDPKKKDALHERIKYQIKEIIIGYIDAKEEELKARQKDFDSGLNAKNREKVWDKIVELHDSIVKARKIINEMLENNFQTTELFLYKLWFGEVMREGGFDIVIGNPPYLRVQGIDREISKRYKEIFDGATGKYDLYVLFVEKGLELLNSNGILNYIMPHKWVNSSFGKGLRKITAPHMKRLISFDAYQVFNASTYTSLLWLSKSRSSVLEYIQLEHDLSTNKELETFLENIDNHAYTNISTKTLDEDIWVLTNKKTYEILEKLNKMPLRVQDISKGIFQGLISGDNDIFYIYEGKFLDDILLGYSKALDRQVHIEKNLCKKIVTGKSISRYFVDFKSTYIIYPYKSENGKTTIIEEEELKKEYPLCYSYFNELSNRLKNRGSKSMKYTKWYALWNARKITTFEKKKILTPDISYKGSMALDINNKYYYNDTAYGIQLKNENTYKFYLSILNSSTCWFYLQNTGSVLRGGYFRFKTNYLNPFPVPGITNLNQLKPFEVLVDYVVWLNAQNENIDSYVDNDHIVKFFEDVLDAMVLELYFKEEMHEAGFNFIAHATEIFKPIDNLSDEQVKKIIYDAYQALREKDNPIRNDLQLLPIRVPMVAPILESV